MLHILQPPSPQRKLSALSPSPRSLRAKGYGVPSRLHISIMIPLVVGFILCCALGVAAVSEKDSRRAAELVDYAVKDLIPVKDYDGALKYLDAALMYDPERWQAFATKGYCYYLKGDYERSLSNYERAQVINPHNEKINKFINRSKAKLGLTAGEAAVGVSEAKKDVAPSREVGIEIVTPGQAAPEYRTPPLKRRRRRSAKNIKTHTRRSWGVETSIIYLEEDALKSAVRNMPIWVKAIGYDDVYAECGGWAKCIAITGGMRAGNDFRLLSSFEYIFGHDLRVEGSLGDYRFFETVSTSAYIITAGFCYLVHKKSIDLGLEAKLGMLESMIQFNCADDLYLYYVGGELAGRRLCFALDMRIERYFTPNFSLFAAPGYRYAKVTKVTGYLSTGATIALATISTTHGEYVDIVSEYVINTVPGINYAQISFGGFCGSFGLEVHY